MREITIHTHWATKNNKHWRAYLALPFFEFQWALKLVKDGLRYSLKLWRWEFIVTTKPERPEGFVLHKHGVHRDEAVYEAYRQKQIEAFEAGETPPNQIVPSEPKNHIVKPHTEHRL